MRYLTALGRLWPAATGSSWSTFLLLQPSAPPTPAPAPNVRGSGRPRCFTPYRPTRPAPFLEGRVKSVGAPASARSAVTRWVRMTGEVAKAPQPDCHRIVIRLRSGIKGGCDRRATSTGKDCLENVHAKPALDTSLRRIDRQQSVQWGGRGGNQGPQPEDAARSGRRGPDPEAWRRGVRSACDSERLTTVTHGQPWSLSSCKCESSQSTFALVRALETSPKLVTSSRLGLSWANRVWLEGCPQVKRVLPTRSGGRGSGSAGWPDRARAGLFA